MTVCVYCSSSDAVDTKYFQVAKELGTALAKRGDVIVYGGASVGLMGALAHSSKAAGGRVIGVLPEKIAAHGIGFASVDEMIVTNTLRERKKVMEERADACVALPGGFGTLEELMEILTLKQLGYHDKAVAILNVNGFYDLLLEFFDHLYGEKFAKPETSEVFSQCDSVTKLTKYLDTYIPANIGNKWFDHHDR
jgi:cytokinin riboside 5'-monophosphate phosphoribohydrolase